MIRILDKEELATIQQAGNKVQNAREKLLAAKIAHSDAHDSSDSTPSEKKKADDHLHECKKELAVAEQGLDVLVGLDVIQSLVAMAQRPVVREAVVVPPTHPFHGQRP